MEIIKIYNENERDFLLSKRGSKYLKVITCCKDCGKEFEVYLYRLKDGFLCRKCKIANTKKSITESEKEIIKEKIKKTCLEKYGVSNVFKNENVKEKSKRTMKEKYGCENARSLQLDSSYIKKHKEKKRVELPEEFVLEKHFEELKDLKVSKWENRDEQTRRQILEKRKQTCLEKYGVEFVAQSEKVKQTVRQNNLKKWGFESPSSSPLVKEKIEKTFREKYGSNHPNFSFIFGGQVFDSSWELAVWIYAKDLKLPIEREPVKLEYEFEGKMHTYYPDFRLNGKLIEVKGPQFFKEGKMVNPFDSSMNDLFEAKHQCGLKNGVEFWGKEDIEPILNYVNEKYTKDFIPLFSKNIQFPFPQLGPKTDYDYIKAYHKSLYKASRKGKKSPYEAWFDKDLVLRSALNRLKYVGRCTPADIVQGFNVAKIAPKVSVFKPKLAENLIKKYIPNADIIIDPFSGFSGRMLGSYNCGIHYVGFDINKEHVKESNEIACYKKIEDMCSVEVQDLISFKGKDWACLKDVYLFTCPPYGGKEHWNENNDEIEKSCDEWIDLCLEKHKGCKGYLFVVDQTEKYKDKIVETITNRSHLGTNKEFVVFVQN